MACQRQKGFTLVEVLIALMVLTIGLLAVASMQTLSVTGNSQAVRTTKAAIWAENTMETLIKRPYQHADLQDVANPGVDGLNCTDLVGNPSCTADGGPSLQGNFTVFWNVADNHPVIGCKIIRVLVRRNHTALERPNVVLDFIKMAPN